ncbi:hypothetical protein BFP76_09915 [Amylibacter kogurei]|uniref:Uncharacterized protein n=1 Tax=Paramylibacter kogurei TaxID=1889778 RepID=A0A2G5JZY7_9RHOB|nr:hypothetical protein BFP76_09915 [Amylibacter kogurei]
MLFHPETGQTCFGVIPEKNTKRFVIPAGDIRLPVGKHRGPHRGYGAKHIWVEHKKEMMQAGFGTWEEVPNYVTTILKVGTPIFYEGGSFKHSRVMAVRSSAGTCILELKEQRDKNIWSIVTAFSGTKPHGVKVGNIQKCATP